MVGFDRLPTWSVVVNTVRRTHVQRIRAQNWARFFTGRRSNLGRSTALPTRGIQAEPLHSSFTSRMGARLTVGSEFALLVQTTTSPQGLQIVCFRRGEKPWSQSSTIMN